MAAACALDLAIVEARAALAHAWFALVPITDAPRRWTFGLFARSCLVRLLGEAHASVLVSGHVMFELIIKCY